MAHKTVTQRPIPMPRQSSLLCRNGRYYFNIRIPKELLPLYEKEYRGGIIRKALNTSDYREAVSRVRFESFKQDSEFSAKRRELSAKAPTTIPAITEREAHELVSRFFIGLEKRSEDWWRLDGHKLAAHELKATLQTLREDSAHYDGGGEHLEAMDGSIEVESFLADEGLSIPKGTEGYRKLCALFRMAKLENLQRTIDRVSRTPVAEREPMFRGVFSHTAMAPERVRVTLGEMLNRFTKALTDAKRTEGTHRTYRVPVRILRETLGENTPLDSITGENIEKLFALLSRAPSNAVKRYRGLTLEEAVAAEDLKRNPDRIGPKTLANYFNNIATIFNFAVEKRLLKENPARDRWLRASFAIKESKAPKVQFSIEELNKLFRAPLFTGCKDDKNGYAKPGTFTKRRGRFWAPLLSLFHGFRCNEAVQLYTEDIKEEEGIPFFEIREEREDGSKCDKRLKTKQSRRRVPIHPELVKMGFLDFVAERRNNTAQPRLFPELPVGNSGYFSDPFSKFFGRFVEGALGEGCKASFHSLRHMFKDALTEAGVPIPDIERLGGWELMQHSAERHYGKGPSLRRLQEQITKVQYPNLDLSHLHAPNLQPVARRRVRMLDI